jgi:hypothetical protein
MRSIASFAVCALLTAFWIAKSAAAPQAKPHESPQFTSDGSLIRPADYRQWIYLSSGLGMNYSAAKGDPGEFTNVFVLPASYRAFLETGHWPDHTIFVLEERAAESKGSIVRSGHYQGDLAGLAASVKDEKRFPEKWAYFSFDRGSDSAAAMGQAQCWQCHNSHAASDNTFVQFYPTLKEIAQKFGTYDAKKAAP